MNAGSSGVAFGQDQAVALTVAQYIARTRGGGAAEVVTVPEADDRTNPAVELITRDSVGLLAIEHTRIEPYPNQIARNQWVQRLGRPLHRQ